MTRRTLVRGLRWTAGIIAVLLVVVLALIWFALGSEWAARRLLAVAVEQTPALTQVGRVMGRLAGPLELRDVVVETAALSARVDLVQLEWRPTALLGRRVELERLHVSGVRVIMADSVPEEPDTLPEQRERIELPVEVVLGDVRVERVAVDAPGGIRLRNLEVAAAGRARDYALRLGGEISTPAVQKVELRAAARGNLDRLTLDSATAALLDGTVTAEGAVAWWPEIGWKLALAGQGLRPGPLLADSAAWPGAISFRAATEGVLDTIGPVAEIVMDTLTGTLRGQPLGGALRVRSRGEEYAIPGLVLSWGPTRLDASGHAGKVLDLRFELSAPRLGLAVPGAAGALTVRGTASGPRDSALIAAEFSGRRLGYGDNNLAALTGRADIGLAPEGRTDLDLRAERVLVAGRRIDRMVVTMRGTRDQHRLSATVESPEALLRLAAAGGLRADSSWGGAIRSLDLQGEQAGHWRLLRPASLSAGSAAAELDTLCLRSGDGAEVCAAGSWRQPGSWRFDSRLVDVPLALAAPFLPQGWSAEGSLSGHAAAAAAADGRLQADAALVPAGAGLVYRADSVTRRIGLDRGKLELRAGPTGVSGGVSLELSGEGGAPIGAINASAELPEFTRLGQAVERQRMAARVEARLPDLASVRPFTSGLEQLAGSVALDLTAGGTVRAPTLHGRLRLTELAARQAAGWAARGALAADMDADVAPDRSLKAEVRVRPRGIVLDLPGDTLPRRMALDTGGVDIRVGPDGVRGTITVALAAASGRPLATVSGELALPEYTKLGEELPAQPVRLRLEGRLPDLGVVREVTPPGTLTALSGNAGLDLTVDGTVGAPRAEGTLQLREARATHARGWSAAGALAAEFEAALGRDSSISGRLLVAPVEATFEYPGDSGARRLAIDTGSVLLNAGPDGVSGTLALRLADLGSNETVGRFDGRLSLPGYHRMGQPAEGQVLEAGLEGRVDDLSFVEAVTDQVDSVAGRLVLDLAVDGTLAKPQVVGGLTFQDGAANLPALGLRLREMRFEAKGDRSGAIALTGGARSGPGSLSLEGTYPVEPSEERPAKILLRGERFEAANIPEARVLVSPRLDIVLSGEQVDVKGEVGVPFARMELAEIPATAVPVSEDVVFMDSTATAAAPRAVAAQVRVILGDSVSFKGFNFTTDLGGSILAVEQPGTGPTATGELVIEEGQYKAYGQDLSISQGRVLYGGGPVDNPGLDIRATRTAEDGVVAGLDIGGTLKAPEVTIFSEPPMAQSEALAYIVLGHPVGQGGSSEDGTLVSQAARSLGLKGGNLLVGSLGREVGLDEARVETEGDLNQASLVAGKYLSPNLYVSYGIGLFDPVSTLRLRYILSSNWTLQAETGTATGTDLLYRIEAGK